MENTKENPRIMTVIALDNAIISARFLAANLEEAIQTASTTQTLIIADISHNAIKIVERLTKLRAAAIFDDSNH